MEHDHLDKAFTRDMTFRYAFALGLLALLAIAAYLVLEENILAQEAHASVVNVAGRQRMLSQRIEVFSLLLVDSEDPVERGDFRLELLDAISLMEKSHDGLINGNPTMNLPGTHSPLARAMYFDSPILLDLQVDRYLSEAKALADAQDPELMKDNPHLQYVISAARDELLNSLDAMVKQYENEAKEDNNNLHRLEEWVLVSTLIVILMVAVFIFRPMVHQIQVDITEHMEDEKRIRGYAEQLESSNKMKDLFTDILRHDLLNPAGVIRNTAELMQDEEDRQELEIILRNAGKIIDVTTTAAQMAKLEGVDHLDVERVDLTEVINDAINQFSDALREKGQEVIFDAEEAEIEANPVIEQVFVNLLSNAIKYSPENTTINLDIGDEQGTWKVSVMDQCPGIKDEDKGKVFTRFKRIKKEGVKGTGLGLAIAKRIVDLHNGEIWVENNPEGRGCAFNVRLPKKQA